MFEVPKKLLNKWNRKLEKAGLPYQFLASRGLYSKPVVLDVISYFKLLDNYHESPALYRILNLPFLDVASEDIAKLTQYSYRKSKSLYEAMGDLPVIFGISEKSRKTIPWLLSLIKKHAALAREKTVAEIMIAFLKDSGYLKYLIDKEGQEEFGVLDQFLKKIKNFEQSALDPSLNNFMREIILEIESKDPFFDININIPIRYEEVYPGEKFVAEIKLFNLENLGLKEVEIEYAIKPPRRS